MESLAYVLLIFSNYFRASTCEGRQCFRLPGNGEVRKAVEDEVIDTINVKESLTIPQICKVDLSIFLERTG